jgi:hypothetical protein
MGTQPKPEEGHAATTRTGAHNHNRGTQPEPEEGHTAKTRGGAHTHNHRRGTATTTTGVQPQPQQGHKSQPQQGHKSQPQEGHKSQTQQGHKSQPQEGHTAITTGGAHGHNHSRDYWIITAVLMDNPVPCLCRRVDWSTELLPF